MSLSRWLAVACLIGPITIGAMLRAAPNDAKTEKKPARALDEPVSKEENNKAFHAELLKIAAKYKTYGRVDDETRWAPWLCRMPMPSVARFSKSDEEETHGQKLYYLFAKDRWSYISLVPKAKTKPKVGQVIGARSQCPRRRGL